MATKEIGYVELEWTCPRCQTRNPGTQTTCGSCGAPQPKDVAFETPTQAELLKDQEKIARAQQGPDIQCAFCGARNPANAPLCKQCGADLAQGAKREAGDVVGAFQSGPAPQVACSNCAMLNPASAHTCSKCGAPLGRPQLVVQPAAAPGAEPAGCSRLAIVVGVLVMALIALFIFFSLRTNTVVGTVREARWTRTLPVEALAPVQREAWWDELPAGAEAEACHAEVRRIQDSPAPNAREVCGTPYTLDTGTGIGKVVQDCRYEVLEELCTYTVNEWRVVDVLEISGSGFAPEWPVAALQPRQRLGVGNEHFRCVVVAGDQWYTYEPTSFAEYQLCEPGAQWTLEINSFGSLMSIQPVEGGN
jgi:ribosomal protein L40E